MILNVINLPSRPDRKESAIQQLDAQGVSYVFWDGVVTKERKVGISIAHKNIVRHAKESNMERVFIAEDDISFTHKDSFKYFIENMPEDFDLYLSGYYSGSVDENNMITKFSGLTLYCVSNQYFDKFLSASEKFHLDTALGMIGGKFYVSPKFCATQVAGFSDQRNRYADDSKRLVGKPMYHG